ncbi:universal stress protein [uncultured Hyphomonas sp.]|uniref:universal stress protein n=1 Tax=uncultured Hyphomonas sp. TaxID=225298 RepID=UPI002AABD63D|nr:universal stress protein [uncultured Hyphomonas sp.]
MTEQTKPPFAATHILVPVDMRHREVSRLAVESAVYLAGLSGAKVSILTVTNPLGTHLTEMPEARKPDFEAFVAEQADRLGHAITPLFESHEAVNETIQKVIKQHGVDFVVMATHHPRLSDHLFGSHASQTALHANCSVLIVRGE